MRRSITTCSGRSSKRSRGGGAPFALLSASLLRWFRTGARKMAWRETRDPYRIWVSEIMLQQTRVETVAPYYARFLARFPDAASLAAAAPDDVLSAWEGLGYYARARNLHRAARIVLERFGGRIPASAGDLMELPGIGRSTAGAIAAIAFGKDEPILDANARRVIARLFAVEGDPRSAPVEARLWDLSARMVAKGAGRDTALAIMDLGAVVCLPGSPRCPGCPLNGSCAAFRAGIQDRIPARAPRKSLPRHDVVAALFRGPGGRYFLRRRPPEGLLGGLWAFPSGTRRPEESLEAALERSIREKLGVSVAIQTDAGVVSHAYSHFRIALHGFLCKVAEGSLPRGDGAGWFRPGDAGTPAMPRADRKLIERRLEEENA